MLAPPQLLALHIAGLIVAGTILLALPMAAEPGRHVSVVDAFFTSTSAVCVTGLVVVDTPTGFSLFGEIVVMLLIQAGGLGYMTISTLIAVALGKRVTLQERLTLQEALNIYTREGLLRFAGLVLRFTLVLELTGAAILAVRWTPDFGVVRASYLGLFHAVSAFNNAGFSLFSDNLVRYRGDLTVNLVITTLIICGGLGFLVLSEVFRLRRRAALSVHTKFVLAVTAALVVGGTLAIFLLERGNPRSLGPLGAGEALLASYFQSVTPRTAGFNTLDIGALTPPTLFLIILLMFIGASPGGTGGGIKTTTFGITMVALWTTVRGKSEPVVFRRRLAPDLVAKAFFISLIAFLAVNLIGWLVLFAERSEFLATIFETTSAFGTVGLSMGRSGSALSLSGHFTAAGKLLEAGMMYLGRVGPLTLAVALAGGVARVHLRHPEAKVLIG
ncbi:MAG: Trk family potassium uptake protein [Acidobacteria bacterium]|nr:Trk family potassium uptake protein [Acidobacteriota bacterium]